MYQALYRKWRPATFADVIGQENIVTALQSQLLHDKVGHAYLFTGTRGTGKTTCAKIFAKAVNCESRNGADPCCVCSTCKGIETGAVMDVVEIDAASNNGVDNIRDLRDETAYTPSVGLYKVYIIDEVHMLSTAAFNALLKIMEEPPRHVIFILATTEIHKVPATILSRCQRYDFVRIAPPAIAKRLEYVAAQEGLSLAPDAAQLIARLADGAMRDALSILDTCVGVSNEVDADTVRRMAGVTDKSYLFTLSDCIAAQAVPGALALIAQLREKSVDIKRLCDELVLHYRNIMLAGISGGRQLLTGVSAEDEEHYVTAAQRVGQANAIRAVKAFCIALDKMGKSADARIELELAVFALCADSEVVTGTPMTQAARPGAQPTVQIATPLPAMPSATASSVASPPPMVSISSNTAGNGIDRSGTQDTAPSQTVSAVAPTAEELPWHEEPQTDTFTSDAHPPKSAPYQATPERTQTQEEFATLAPAPEQAQAADKTPPSLPPPASVQSGASQSDVPFAEQQGGPTALTSSTAPTASAQSMEPFALWGEVINAMEPKDKLLFVNMRNSKAYFDGKRVRIDGSDLFMEYMRSNQYSSALIKEVIAQVTGAQYSIGPYEKPTQTVAQGPSAEQALAQLEAQGVPVIYHDK